MGGNKLMTITGNALLLIDLETMQQSFYPGIDGGESIDSPPHGMDLEFGVTHAPNILNHELKRRTVELLLSRALIMPCS